MMQVARSIGVFVSGLALGAIGASVLSPSNRAVDIPTEPRPIELPVARDRAAPEPTPSGAPPTGGLDACEAALQIATAEVVGLTRTVSLLGGTRSEWTESVPDAFRPPAIRDWLPGHLERTGADLLELDCNESPCMAVLRYPETVSSASTAVKALQEEFGAHTDGIHQPQSSVFGDVPGLAVVSFGARGATDEVNHRIRIRLGDLGEPWVSELVDARTGE